MKVCNTTKHVNMNGNDIQLLEGIQYNDVVADRFPQFFEQESIKVELKEVVEVVAEVESKQELLIEDIVVEKPIKIKKQKEIVPEVEQELLIEDSSDVTIEVTE